MKQLLSFLLFFTVTGTLYAQQNQGFNGVFVFNKQGSEIGQLPQWVIPVRFKLNSDKSQITISRTTVNQKGEESSFTETLHFGSDTVETTISGGLKRRATVRWNADKTILSLNSNSISPDGQAGSKITETWSLANGDKTLIIEREVEQANGTKYGSKAAYDKQ